MEYSLQRRKDYEIFQNIFSALHFLGIQRILVRFYLLGPLGGVSTANLENGEGHKFCPGAKDHLFVALVSYDGAITGPSGERCGRRNALPLHTSSLLHIV